MDPISAAGFALTGAGGGLSALSQITGAKAQSAMYMYKAGVANANAQVANLQANYDEEVGGLKATEVGLQGADIISRSKAAFGSGNIAVGSGSSGKVLGSELHIAQTNEKIVMSDADHAAYNERIRAATSTAEAGADVTGASTSKTAGTLGAVGSIIGTAGNLASKWTTYSAYGTPVSQGGSGVNPDSPAGRIAYSNSIYS